MVRVPEPQTSRRLEILAVSPGRPRPDFSAGDQRYFAMLEILARTHVVDVFALSHVESST
jgi:hypothetical protein